MKVLIAEDEPVTRRMLEISLQQAGHEVTAVQNGAEAWRILQTEAAPKLVLLDWVMPEMDGLTVIRNVRAVPSSQPPYIILLTVKDELDGIVDALDSGANDYVTKLKDMRELVSRVRVGERVVHLQAELACRLEEAEHALSEIKRLQGLLPICAYCKKIRNDQNYWQEIELYVHEHSEADFSHGICPDCYEKRTKPEIESFTTRMREERKGGG